MLEVMKAMNQMVLSLSLAALCAASAVAGACEPKISVFASFIRSISEQRGVSKSAAADMLYDIGVRGFDAGPGEPDLDELAATRLKPVNFYYFPDWFGSGKGTDEIPDLRFALDSGNLYYAGRGEDILEMMAFAKGRVGHVHLKDQSAADNHGFVTLGMGAVPNERIVKAVAGSGYDGWYTLENPVGDVMNDSVRQVAVVSRWISEVQGVSGRPRCVCSECG